MDELIVQAEPTPDVPADRIAALQAKLAEKLRAKWPRSIVQMTAPLSALNPMQNISSTNAGYMRNDEMSVGSS